MIPYILKNEITLMKWIFRSKRPNKTKKTRTPYTPMPTAAYIPYETEFSITRLIVNFLFVVPSELVNWQVNTFPASLNFNVVLELLGCTMTPSLTRDPYYIHFLLYFTCYVLFKKYLTIKPTNITRRGKCIYLT